MGGLAAVSAALALNRFQRAAATEGFQRASITKPMTATMVGALVEMGLVERDGLIISVWSCLAVSESLDVCCEISVRRFLWASIIERLKSG